MTDSPHFFRVILPDDVQNGNLRIPAKFARKHGSDLSHSVHLKVPSGLVWEVKLHRKKDKDILMQDGWAEFMEHYRIGHGSFVLFKYQGVSQFRVVIFDLTACEIDYHIEPVVHTLADLPSSVPEREKTREKEAPIILSSNDGDDVQLLDNRKIRKRLRCPHSTVVKIVSGLQAANYLLEVKVQATGKELDGARARETFGCHPPVHFCREMSTSYIENLERSTTLLRVLSFRRDRPSFVVLPSFFHSEYYLYVLEKFIMPRIPGIVDYLDVKIYIPGHRMWTVCFHGGKGWQQFAVDNNLKVGDVCLFELTERYAVTYRAFIFRDGGVSRSRRLPMKEKPVTVELVYQGYPSRLDDVYISEVNDQVLGRNPSFSVVNDQVLGRNPSFHVVFDRKMENTLTVPCNFVRNHLQQLLGEVVSHVTLKAGGKLWPVVLPALETCGNSCMLSMGWPRFAEDNDLRRGDICFFELIDETDMVLEVSILKRISPWC